MPLPLPRRDRWVKSLMGRPIPPVSLFANDDGLPHPVSGSAPTSLPFEACSAFTRVTACRLAAPPGGASVSKAPTASSPPPPLRELPAGATQLPGGTRTHWETPPFTAHNRVAASVRRGKVLIFRS